MYLSDRIQYELRNDLSLNHKDCEDLWVNLKMKTNHSNSTVRSVCENFVVAVIYRHPRQNYESFTESLCKSLDKLNQSKTRYVIVGDFNVNTEKHNLVSNVTNYVNSIHSHDCNFLSTCLLELPLIALVVSIMFIPTYLLLT